MRQLERPGHRHHEHLRTVDASAVELGERRLEQLIRDPEIRARDDDADPAARAARLALEHTDVVGDVELALLVARDPKLGLLARVLVVLVGLGGLVLDVVGVGVGLLPGPRFARAHGAIV